jgi:hypothetical protein
MNNFRNPLTEKIARFLNGIGIEIVPADLPDETFLPGIKVENGKLRVDEARLKYPGDLLHEAGHLALAAGDVRPALSGEVIIPGEDPDEIEVAATAWAFAAATFLAVEPRILFHEGGYQGKSESLILTYSTGVYPGVFSLQRFGLTVAGKAADEAGVAPYPYMLKWVRD